MPYSNMHLYRGSTRMGPAGFWVVPWRLRQGQPHLKGSVGVSCIYLDTCVATLRDVMKTDCTIVMCVINVSLRICREDISYSDLRVMLSHISHE